MSATSDLGGEPGSVEFGGPPRRPESKDGSEKDRDADRPAAAGKPLLRVIPGGKGKTEGGSEKPEKKPDEPVVSSSDKPGPDESEAV